MSKLKQIGAGLFAREVWIFLVIGAILLYLNGQYFFPSFKKAVDFDYLIDEKSEAGMHIEGDVVFALDSFATEETWTENRDGSRTPKKTSSYYYMIPTAEGYAGLKVLAKDHSTMEKLVEETWSYIMEEGDEPTTKLTVSGISVPMKEDLKKYFIDYLEEMEFSQQEIDDMGQIVLIEPISIRAVQIMTFIGIACLLLAVVLFVVRYKRSA